MAVKTFLDEMGINPGKKARLHKIMYSYGPRNGRAVFLPVDQGLEHGPRDFVPNWEAADTRWLFKLAKEGQFNAIVLQIGQAEKFFWEFAGEVPLVLKLNGKTEIPSDEAAFSPVQTIPAVTNGRGFVAAMSDAGDAIVAWIVSGSDQERSVVETASCSETTSSCDGSLTFPSAGYAAPYSLRLDINGAGAFGLVWQTLGVGDSSDLRVIRGATEGMRVRSDQRLGASGAVYPRVAVSPAGVTTVVWQHLVSYAAACKCNDTVGIVRLVAAAPGARFRHAISVSGPTAAEPTVWVTPSGEALVSWYERGQTFARLIGTAPRGATLPVT